MEVFNAETISADKETQSTYHSLSEKNVEFKNMCDNTRYPLNWMYSVLSYQPCSNSFLHSLMALLTKEIV